MSLPAQMLARRREDALEGVRCVRVVDDHGERLPLVHRLEPTGNAVRCPTPRTIASSARPSSRARGDGTEDVLDVEATAQTGTESQPAGVNDAAVGVSSRPSGRIVRVGGEAEGEQRDPSARSSSASRRPYGSPTLTAAGGRRPSGSGSKNSRRFASK